MHGDGTRTATTTDRPAARCLDLTRLISRAGRGPLTGVDRVELAYLTHLLNDDLPLYLLARTALGYLLLDTAGARAIAARLGGAAPWGAADVIGHLSRRATPAKRRAEADLRRFSVDRCRRGRLAGMLRRALPERCAYLNVGHSNLSAEVLDAWRGLARARVTVLIHDTIPLDFPYYQRAGAPARFEAKLKRVARTADLVICVSRQTQSDVARWFARWGVVPDTLVAHIGVDTAQPDPAGLPRDLALTDPFFLTVGTIEPRKNHALLLDVWEGFESELSQDKIPQLVIAGRRGWANADVFGRLESSPVVRRTVVEYPDLSDGAIATLMCRAAGVLFPTRAEGFGLPPAEAILRGAPVICSDLPVFREILGNIPVYLDSDDVYLWKQSITRLADEKRAERADRAGEIPETGIPTWADHFNLVLKVA